MKLVGSAPSPFVRKVLIVAIEIGVFDKIDRIFPKTTPIAPNDQLIRVNPLAKMPTLITQSGATLYDSRVICEYLDSLHQGNRMFPEGLEDRWKALRLQALGDGLLDAAVSIRYETILRPQNKYWPSWVEGQLGKVHRALDTIEREVDTFDDVVDIGTIATACAAGYLDFRFPEEDWRTLRPSLSGWYNEFSNRKSMMATEHTAT